MENNEAALKEELLKIVEECLEKGESNKAVDALNNSKFSTCVQTSSWDLIPKIVERLSHCDENISAGAQEILMELAQLANPDEMLLELIEKTEDTKNDSVFLALLTPMQSTLLRMPDKRGRSLQWSLNAISLHLTFEFSDSESDPSEDENEDDAEDDNRRVLKLCRAALQFCQPFIEEVALNIPVVSCDKPVLEIRKQQRRVLLTFLVQMLAQVLANVDLHYDGVRKSPFRHLAEATVDAFCRLCSDPFYFLTFMDERYQTSQRVRNRHTDEVWEDVNPFLFDEVTPLAGLGTLYYLILVERVHPEYAPSVYSPVFIFQSTLHVVVCLTARSESLAVIKGFEIAESSLRRLGRPPLSAELLDDPIHSKFCKATIKAVFRGSEETARLSAGVLKTYLKCFSQKGQYLIFKNLFASLEEQGARGFLVSLLKDAIDRSLREHGSEEDASVFRGESLCELIKSFCSFPEGIETDVMVHSDHIIACLNFVWYLALCREAQALGIHLMAPFLDNLLRELDYAVWQCRNRYEIYKAEVSKENVNGDDTESYDKKLHGHGLASVREQLDAIETTMNKLMLIDNLIDDVDMAVNSARGFVF